MTANDTVFGAFGQPCFDDLAGIDQTHLSAGIRATSFFRYARGQLHRDRKTPPVPVIVPRMGAPNTAITASPIIIVGNCA
jgi:hypothetical protein